MHVIITYTNGKQYHYPIDEFNYNQDLLTGLRKLSVLKKGGVGFEFFQDRPEIQNVQIVPKLPSYILAVDRV